MMVKSAFYTATYVMERRTVWMDPMKRDAKKPASKVGFCWVSFFSFDLLVEYCALTFVSDAMTVTTLDCGQLQVNFSASMVKCAFLKPRFVMEGRSVRISPMN